MTNNSGAVVNLLGDLTAVLSHDIGALLDVSGVDDHVVFLMASLIVVGFTMLVVNNIVHDMAHGSLVMARGRVGKTGAGEQESCTNFIHYGVFLPTFLLREELKQTAKNLRRIG